MALLLIAVAWMLLAVTVVGLCRAARLGEDAIGQRPPSQVALPLEPAEGAATVTVRDARIEASRGLGTARGPARTGRFTKSSRRRAGLHRA